MSEVRLEAPATLDQETGRALVDDVGQRGIAAGQAVVLDLSNTEAMDTRGSAWIVELAHQVRARHQTATV